MKDERDRHTREIERLEKKISAEEAKNLSLAQLSENRLTQMQVDLAAAQAENKLSNQALS